MWRRFEFSLRALRAPPASSAAKWITIFSLAVYAAAVIATTVVFLHGANPIESLWSPALSDALVISPYIGLAIAALLTSRNTAAAMAGAVGTVLVSGYAALVMVDLFVNHPDPQNAFLLLIVPVCQWVGIIATLIVAAVAWFIDRMLRRH